MTAARHTPGPWEFDGHSRVDAVSFRKQTTIKQEDGTVAPYTEGLVALPYPCGGIGTHRANAHVIAASPDMLQLLLEVQDGVYDADPVAHSNWLARVDAAILKALGFAS